MDALTISDHTEWWITFEHRTGLEDSHGIYGKYFNEPAAREHLARVRAKFPDTAFEVQLVLVHRTAQKLDW